MRWPFVSRVAYEAACDRANAEHENAQFLRRDAMNSAEQWAALINKADLRYDALLAMYQEAVGPAPLTLPMAPTEPVEPSQINKVIREQASESGRYDQGLATHLRGYAKQLKAQGLNDDEIVGKLVEWQNTEAMFLN